MLRRVMLRDNEVCRGIYGAVRDADWNTVEPRLEKLEIDQQPDTFAITFEAWCRSGEASFRWRGKITGDAGGCIDYRFSGRAESDFQRNRIGLCVLHPMAECSGLPCQIEHVDGRVTEDRFPKAISPHQPFFEIRSICHQVRPGLDVVVRMEGDTFEMEDQRNWTDASFKTYSTPLALPFPVSVKSGDAVEQSVSIRWQGNLTAASRLAAAPGECEIDVDWDATTPWTPLGLQASPAGHRLSPIEVELLRQLQLDHLRLDIDLNSTGWEQTLAQGLNECQEISCRPLLAVTLSDNSIHRLQALKPILPDDVDTIVIFHRQEKVTPEPLLEQAENLLHHPVAGGTNAYFTELNRNRPPSDSTRGQAYSINPQVHAFDDLSLMETLEAQPVTLTCAREFCQGPLVVGPITLLPRFNPNATGDPSAPVPRNDPRQRTGFGAAWTLGSLVVLQGREGLAKLTYHQTTGGAGVLEGEETFPCYDILRALAGAAHVARVSNKARPGKIAALPIIDTNGAKRVVLANLTGQEENASLQGSRHLLGPYDCKTIDKLATIQ